MSLADYGTVDLVTRLPGDASKVALVVYDDGNVSDDFEREAALEKKLSTYVMFVKTGQFREAYPDLNRCTLIVEVVCSTPPTHHMKQIETIADDEFVLPVNVGMESDFRARLGLAG